MAAPASREELKQYALRNLGAPVLEINVDDDQLEDRIDEAMSMWNQYHWDGIEKIYMKHKLTGSLLKITTPVANSFGKNVILRGLTSGAQAIVHSAKDDNTLELGNISNPVKFDTSGFVEGEIVTDGTTSATVQTGTDWFTAGDFETKSIPVGDAVYGVTQILPLAGTSSSKNMFDIQYQLRLNDLYDLTSTSIIYYKTVMNHLDLLDFTLNGKIQFRFNRMQKKVYLDVNWAQNFNIGDWIIAECYAIIDPQVYTAVWNEQWLKAYVTALFKRQWATNLKKFSGLQLPGGVTLDGDKLYAEASQEIKDLEDDLRNKSAPLEFMMG
jgi:hypothetical protein